MWINAKAWGSEFIRWQNVSAARWRGEGRERMVKKTKCRHESKHSEREFGKGTDGPKRAQVSESSLNRRRRNRSESRWVSQMREGKCLRAADNPRARG